MSHERGLDREWEYPIQEALNSYSFVCMYISYYVSKIRDVNAHYPSQSSDTNS